MIPFSVPRSVSRLIPLTQHCLLVLPFLCMLSPSLVAGPARSAEGPIGDWQLDSLAVYPLPGELPDSTRQALSRFEATIKGANEQLCSGELRIVTRYRADSRYEHAVIPRDTTQPGALHRERGRWSYGPATRRIACCSNAGRPCVHDRAVVERVMPVSLELRLALIGRGTGLGEYFLLRRTEP